MNKLQEKLTPGDIVVTRSNDKFQYLGDNILINQEKQLILDIADYSDDLLYDIDLDYDIFRIYHPTITQAYLFESCKLGKIIYDYNFKTKQGKWKI